MINASAAMVYSSTIIFDIIRVDVPTLLIKIQKYLHRSILQFQSRREGLKIAVKLVLTQFSPGLIRV